MISSMITNVAMSALLATSSAIPTVSIADFQVYTSKNDAIIAHEINAFPRAGERIKHRKVTVTAYSSTVDQTDSTPFITANNTVVRDGIVAANFLPFGARVRFPSLFGTKEFVVADRMNERYTRRIDIWMPSRLQATQFGVKYVEVELLPPLITVAYQ